jgi:hypothetical protein
MRVRHFPILDSDARLENDLSAPLPPGRTSIVLGCAWVQGADAFGLLSNAARRPAAGARCVLPHPFGPRDHRQLIHLLGVIGLRHGQFIEVREQRRPQSSFRSHPHSFRGSPTRSLRVFTQGPGGGSARLRHSPEPSPAGQRPRPRSFGMCRAHHMNSPIVSNRSSKLRPKGATIHET